MSDDTPRCLCGHLSTFHRRDHGPNRYLADCVRCDCPEFEDDESDPNQEEPEFVPFGESPDDFV